MKAFAAAVVLAIPALAAGVGPASADCQCIGNGTKYEQGELACLTLPSGPVLARCDKVLNNSSWTKVGDGCPQAWVGTIRESTPQTQSGGGRTRPFGLFNLFRG